MDDRPRVIEWVRDGWLLGVDRAGEGA